MLPTADLQDYDTKGVKRSPMVNTSTCDVSLAIIFDLLCRMWHFCDNYDIRFARLRIRILRPDRRAAWKSNNGSLENSLEATYPAQSRSQRWSPGRTNPSTSADAPR